MTVAQTTDDATASAIVAVSVRPDGVALVTINDRKAPFNTITEELGSELARAVARLESDASIVGAVLLSGKEDSFVVGANIDMLKSIKFATDAEKMSRDLAKELGRLRMLPKPTVAAVNGQALGGGFELALACRAIVLSDDKKTTVGLPEVQLGLLPGAHGLLRVAERAGLRVALDLGLTGKTVRPSKAKRIGLCEEVCAPAVMLEAAVEMVKDLVAGKDVSPHRKGLAFDAARLQALALESTPIGRGVLFRKARQETRKKTHGHYPATERILDVLECFGSRGFSAAADLEAKSFGELVVSETAHRLVEVFFATTALKKDTGIDDLAVTPRKVEHVAMLGGGLMGGGIAFVTINSGVTVRLKDKDDAGVGRGLAYVKGILDGRVKKKQISREERDQIFARLTATTEYTGLKHVDVVIEAVFEDLELKQRVLREVEERTGDACIFASNTSSIPLTQIAAASKRPHNVVGMHYFSPVPKMPLLEVIRTERTDPEVVATAVLLGKKQGKTVIVVKDGPGFYTSRILAPLMNEAAYMLAEGVPVESIDRAMVDWGWPVGPIQLLDEVGVDVATHVGDVLHGAFGDRLAPPGALTRLAADDRKGRKNGRGFYRYDKDAMKGGKRQVDVSAYKALDIDPKSRLPAEEIQMRCSLQFVNEALLSFGEGLLRGPRDGDIGAIFGLGFPPFRGGPFRYTDGIGAAEILRRILAYEDRLGKRWTPAPILVEMAKSGSSFYAS
jgi:3-hydroxyacyl-CoA dehydrogenase / enoyl-CoA hydratase / 3-hydroxybutyryl-CoA epimerase